MADASGMADGCTLPVETVRADVMTAQRAARDLAGALGFASAEIEMVAIAATELATNLARYGERGTLTIAPIAEADTAGIAITSDDRGPGIPDLAAAMQDGFSTGGGLGSGLPAVRRLMDEFAITSNSAGTRVTCKKWLNSR
jgi:serine/threonine-protein kinase RsbT